MNHIVIALVVGAACAATIIIAAYFLHLNPLRSKLNAVGAELEDKRQSFEKEIEARKKEVLLEAKEEAYRLRQDSRR